MVRLAAGLNDNGELSAEVETRALACLERFGHLLAELPPENVRVLGTNTLRRLQNRSAFIEQAEQRLNHVVEIISGIEEARLIYAGVAHDLSDEGRQRLVIDIGGGSTECIIGRGRTPLELESLAMGCVSHTQRYFGDGKLGKKAMRRARIAAAREIEPLVEHYGEIGWQRAIGASGTVRAIGRVLAVEEDGRAGRIHRDGLEALFERLAACRSLDAIRLKGLSDARRPVFAGGVAILKALFDEFGIDEMEVSDGALREGALYDLLGRRQQADVREATVAAMAARYGVDMAQAERVQSTLDELFRQGAADWSLDQGDNRKLLSWAAHLHEIGLDIAHAQYHRHGAYILNYADMPGFSRQEQRVLALLVRTQRRKFPRDEIADFHRDDQLLLQRMGILLRLAVLLHRGRRAEALPAFSLAVMKKGLVLKFPSGWLEANPLTAADLAQEQAYLAATSFELRFA